MKKFGATFAMLRDTDSSFECDCYVILCFSSSLCLTSNKIGSRTISPKEKILVQLIHGSMHTFHLC